MTYGPLYRLPVVSDSERYCAECGEKLIDRYEETEYFDRVTGTPYKFQTRTCPNWRDSWLGINRHDRVRLHTVAEINQILVQRRGTP